ncbi:MAG: adenylate/guanylate cyclase domain-containing protein [Pseudomonadota bacterium]
MTVLLVDDTRLNIMMLEEILAGYRQRVAMDGEAALASVADDGPPDLILLDVNMPRLDGLEVCRRLKADLETRDIPIIFLTGQADKETVVEGFRLGANDYVSKPFDVDELRLRVETQLRVVAQRRQIVAEQAKSEQLLHNILPDDVARELKETGASRPRYFASASVLFADLVGFTRSTRGMAPEQLIGLLNEIFQGFDEILARHGLEKIKTLGDGYLCAAGVPVENDSNATDAVAAALDMQAFMVSWNADRAAGEDWRLGIGIHSGELVAGVIGVSKFAYDIWGETVNVAARLVDTAGPGRINVSAATLEQLPHGCRATPRGRIPIKNMGEMDMFFIEALA